VGELDGVWQVTRLSGALPPLWGVRKQISGARGRTLVGGFSVPFDVHGHELHYRAPLNGVVDVLEPAPHGFHGRTAVFGREIGTFELRRTEMAEDLQAQLVKHIDEAHALEQNVLRMLDSMIQTTDDPQVIDRLEHHKVQTQTHAERMRQRLRAHDATPSMVRQAAGIAAALAKMPLDMIRGESAGRNARDAYATEHLEIASYELLARVAERAGDEETASIAREIIGEEREMASFIEDNWDLFAQSSLREAGVA
jgi:ferritin-like metal-binding protein YciE